MVEKPGDRIPPGSVVDIVDRDGQWVGRGFFNWHSRIALRLLTANADEAVDVDFFTRRIVRALELRRNLLKLDEVTDACRLVHSEGDGLSGLIVDRFGATVVMEFFSAGMMRQRQVIQEILTQLLPSPPVLQGRGAGGEGAEVQEKPQFYWFAEEHVQKQESLDFHAPEPPAPSVITEHGLRFRVAPGSKHKTGFFTDQRDNRKTLASFCAGKRVLDLCCNTGGFAVYAKALGQAEDVVGVDLDEQAIALAKQNANLNQAKIRFVQGDLFTWLRDTRPSGERYDVVILDPSKQTRDRDEIDFALKRYFDMNKLALQAVAPGGIFLTCSCTGLISEEMFLETLRRAAWQAGRTLQVLKLAGAGADHPVLAHVPEGRYLKAVFCRVLEC